MTVRNSLLAMLAQEPTHGYALKSDFETCTAGTWPLNVGQVYSTLSRLERDGLVEALDDEDADRRRWQITAAGRRALAAWYGSPVDDRPARDEVVIKVLVALSAGEPEMSRVLQVQRTATMGRLQDYTRHKRATRPEDDLPETLMLDALILRAEAEIRWLDLCEQRLAVQTGAPT